MVASLRMMNENWLFHEQREIHSSFFILYSLFLFTQNLYETFTNYNSFIDKPFGQCTKTETNESHPN